MKAGKWVVHYSPIVKGAEEIAESVNVPEELSSSPSAYIKAQTYLHAPVSPTTVDRDKQILGARCLVSTAVVRRCSFSQRACLRL